MNETKETSNKSYDRRKLQRRHLIYYLRVFEVESEKILGHLVDVTQDGVMLISEEAIPIGVVFHLKMSLPMEYAGKPYLEFDAKSLWSARDINPDFINTGFTLLNIEQDEKDVINQIISDYGFRD